MGQNHLCLKGELIRITKISCFYIYKKLHFTFIKKNCLTNLAKLLKNILQLLTELQFDICYVTKTRVGFEIAEITRFLNCFSSYSFGL